MVVGTEGVTKTWHLPKQLLVKASPFFAAALNGPFAEATSKLVNLPEDNTDAFALFIRWLFVGDISGKSFHSGYKPSGYKPSGYKRSGKWPSGYKDSGDEVLGTWGDTSNSSAFFPSMQVCLQACILGDKLGCPMFHDLAMLELIESHKSGGISSKTMQFAFEMSAPGSKLRRFSIDQLRYDIECGTVSEDAAAYVSAAKIAEDFALDFLKACIEGNCRNAIDPIAHRGQYMEVWTFMEEG